MIKSTQKFIIVLFILLPLALFPQEKDFVFEQITNESGRSLGFITGIVQDDLGFMWFATRGGLYRYNGYSYKLFKHDKKDSLSLPFNDITYLYNDTQNHLWVRHYDQLTAFSDEKRIFSFDSITNKHYDIEVKILQDKKGFYWMAPTGKGIAKYDAKSDTYQQYTCPPKSFTPKAWNYIDSIIANNPAVAQIVNPGNEADTSVFFTIIKSGNYLIACTGEFDKSRYYDFGKLYKNGEEIWAFNRDNAMWSGGEEKNQFNAQTMHLDTGKYQLTYQSDYSHCCNSWDGKPPTFIEFCGITISELSQKEKAQLTPEFLKPFKSKFHLLSPHIKDILLDNNDELWFLSDLGVDKYNYKKEQFVHYPIDFESLFGTSVKNEYLRFFIDKQGTFWIGSRYGLIKYDNLWGKIVLFQNSPNKQVLTSNTIHSVFEDNNQQIWIGTDKGISIYDRERNTMTKVTRNNHNRLYDNRIMQIYEDQSGNIWIATFSGLNRLIKNQFTYTDLGITADFTYPAFYDASANIWLGVGNQIKKYSRTYTTTESYTIPDKYFNTNDFTGEPDYTINDLTETADHHIWFAADNKVNRFNILTKNIDYSFYAQAIIVGSDSIKNSVKQLIEINNKLYAFCPNGFYVINTQTLKQEDFYPFNIPADFIEEIDINYFKTAIKDNTGNLWIRTADGIYFCNIHLKTLELLFEFSTEFKGRPLADGEMDFDKYGNLWFATLPYINKINLESHKSESFKCNLEHEWGITHTKVGGRVIWNYGSNGLYAFNTITKKFDYYSIEDGLIDNNINGLEEDNLGYLWLTTEKGLIKLDTAEHNAKNHFTANSFTSHRFLGNSRNFKLKGSEKILFTSHGFLSFNPDSINTIKPNIVIDKFTMRGKDFPLDTLIYYKHNLKLNYKQNFLGFEFAALDYTDPAANKYKYKLIGLEDEWNNVDANNRRANYSGISPGNYTLRIIGSNNDKVWNEKGVTLDITITPPWYKTIVAYIIYAIILIVSVWLFITIREKRLIEEKQILEQKVRERTAEIEAQKEELASQNEKIAEQNKNITDSIQYAQRIQRAILPPTEPLHQVLDDYFILYRPRDIVSGDYYWTTQQNHLTIIVAADCTGHGVPGAFMSMLGIAFFNEIVNKEGIVEPNLILDRLRNQIINQLHQKGEEGEAKDGMDLSMYVINHDTMQLSFSGAYNPLFIIRNGEVIQLKADRMPIGYHIKKDLPFTRQDFHLQKGDCVYNSSDGYPDQFGGPDGRKFMTKNFKNLLLDIHKKPMAEQKDILNTTFDQWRGETEQIDDVIVIGVRI